MNNEVLALYGVAADVQKIAPDKVAEISKIVAKAFVNSTMTDGQKHLAAKAKLLSQEAQSKLANGQMEFTSLVKYIRRDISLLAGNFNVFEESVDKETGVSNFSKARLSPSENMMLERIELNFDRGTGITTKTADLAPIANTDDNALYNGEVEIQANGRVIANIPVNSFNMPPRGVQGVAGNCNGYNLSAPKLIKEDEDIQIVIKFAGTMATSTDKDIVEFKLIGDGVKVRN